MQEETVIRDPSRREVTVVGSGTARGGGGWMSFLNAHWRVIQGLNPDRIRGGQGQNLGKTAWGGGREVGRRAGTSSGTVRFLLLTGCPPRLSE